VNYILPTFVQGLYALPSLLTLLVGIVLIQVRVGGSAPRRRALGLAGCGVLLLNGLVNVGYVTALPYIIGNLRFGAGYSLLVGVTTLLQTLLYSLGLGLLLAAVITKPS
jgi:hypothetical protein